MKATNPSRQESIEVAVRIRPLSTKEILSQQSSIWTTEQSSTVLIPSAKYSELIELRKIPPGQKTQYTFNRCFESATSNQTIYEQVVQRIALSSLNGINGTIFMYGQTGSGKTFTMMGNHHDKHPHATLAFQQRSSNNSNGFIINTNNSNMRGQSGQQQQPLRSPLRGQNNSNSLIKMHQPITQNNIDKPTNSYSLGNLLRGGNQFQRQIGSKGMSSSPNRQPSTAGISSLIQDQQAFKNKNTNSKPAGYPRVSSADPHLLAASNTRDLPYQNYNPLEKPINPIISDSHPGILELSLQDIFRSMSQAPERQYLLRCSYIEIYTDFVYDLLQQRERLAETLQIGEDQSKEFFVKGAVEVMVDSIGEILQLLSHGESNRHYASTAMNHISSRSHTIFRLYVRSMPRDFGAGSEGITESVLNFVDLAGSEKISIHQSSGLSSEAISSSKERQIESKTINKSLFFLTQVISLKSAGKQEQFIPYRNSPLTKILRSSLGGNSRTGIILCLNPCVEQLDQSMSTLRFGMHANHIQNTVSQNYIMLRDTTALNKLVNDYQARIQLLEDETNNTRDKSNNLLKMIQSLIEQKNTLEMQLLHVGRSPIQNLRNNHHHLSNVSASLACDFDWWEDFIHINNVGIIKVNRKTTNNKHFTEAAIKSTTIQDLQLYPLQNRIQEEKKNQFELEYENLKKENILLKEELLHYKSSTIERLHHMNQDQLKEMERNAEQLLSNIRIIQSNSIVSQQIHKEITQEISCQIKDYQQHRQKFILQSTSLKSDTISKPTQIQFLKLQQQEQTQNQAKELEKQLCLFQKVDSPRYPESLLLSVPQAIATQSQQQQQPQRNSIQQQLDNDHRHLSQELNVTSQQLLIHQKSQSNLRNDSCNFLENAKLTSSFIAKSSENNSLNSSRNSCAQVVISSNDNSNNQNSNTIIPANRDIKNNETNHLISSYPQIVTSINSNPYNFSQNPPSILPQTSTNANSTSQFQSQLASEALFSKSTEGRPKGYSCNALTYDSSIPFQITPTANQAISIQQISNSYKQSSIPTRTASVPYFQPLDITPNTVSTSAATPSNLATITLPLNNKLQTQTAMKSFFESRSLTTQMSQFFNTDTRTPHHHHPSQLQFLSSKDNSTIDIHHTASAMNTSSQQQQPQTNQYKNLQIETNLDHSSNGGYNQTQITPTASSSSTTKAFPKPPMRSSSQGSRLNSFKVNDINTQASALQQDFQEPESASSSKYPIFANKTSSSKDLLIHSKTIIQAIHQPRFKDKCYDKENFHGFKLSLPTQNANESALFGISSKNNIPLRQSNRNSCKDNQQQHVQQLRHNHNLQSSICSQLSLSKNSSLRDIQIGKFQMSAASHLNISSSSSSLTPKSTFKQAISKFSQPN